MNPWWTSVVAVVLGTTLATSAQAGGRGTHVSRSGPIGHAGFSSGWHGSSNHYRVSGTVSSRTWSHRYWDRRYGCYLYWNPSASCYYYWCAPQSCYYPVSYCPGGTYCWAQPVGGVLPTPAADVPTVTATALATVTVGGGLAPAPAPGPLP